MPEQRPTLVPSTYLILMRDNSILLSRRYNTGYCDGSYSFPAGHLDGGETVKQAMVREAAEEIGVILKPGDLELVHVMNRKIPNNERVDFFFTAKQWQGVPKNMEPEKCDDLQWFELNNLPPNIIPYIKQAIDSVLHSTIYSEREDKS